MPLSDKALFDHLVFRRVSLIGYLLSIVRDENLAEDLFQMVCQRTLEHRDRIENEDHLAKWLTVTARNLAYNELKRGRGRVVGVDAQWLDQLDHAWAQRPDVKDSARTEALRACLNQLSERSRRIVRMRYVDNLTGQRLADAVGRSSNTVSVALSRIHRYLADCVTRRLESEADA
ncbi:MAG: sigma-70 family RNA polymerase sigma factor [Planctomycetes bacterium]|nr:sigma-70 family RNA polymerase sigma factor [Planctomycetota bacterium]